MSQALLLILAVALVVAAVWGTVQACRDNEIHDIVRRGPR